MKRKISMQNIKKISLNEAFEKFINYKIAMNKAKHTIIYYEKCFNFFSVFIREEKSVELANQINEDFIIDYVLYKRNKSPFPTTCFFFYC